MDWGQGSRSKFRTGIGSEIKDSDRNRNIGIKIEEREQDY
jgi:hypothetical protein